MKYKLKDLTKRAKDEIKTDEDLIILTIISILIAGFAVYMDSIPLLIGSMLIGPFFDPILSIVVLGFDHKKDKPAFTAIASLLLITVISIAVGVFQYVLINIFTDFTPVELIPLGFIESFLVAFLLGGVGMFLWVWPKASNTSAGISIAISIVPVLVNISIGLVYCDTLAIAYYTSLYLINILGIILGGLLVLMYLVKKNGK